MEPPIRPPARWSEVLFLTVLILISVLCSLAILVVGSAASGGLASAHPLLIYAASSFFYALMAGAAMVRLGDKVVVTVSGRPDPLDFSASASLAYRYLVDSQPLVSVYLVLGAALILLGGLSASRWGGATLLGLTQGIAFTLGGHGLSSIVRVINDPEGQASAFVRRRLQQVMFGTRDKVVVEGGGWLGGAVTSWLLDSGWVSGGGPAILIPREAKVPREGVLALEWAPLVESLLVIEEPREDWIFRADTSEGEVGVKVVRPLRRIRRDVYIPVIRVPIHRLWTGTRPHPVFSGARLFISTSPDPESYLFLTRLERTMPDVVGRIPEELEFSHGIRGEAAWYFPERIVGYFSLGLTFGLLPPEVTAGSIVVFVGGGREVFYAMESLLYTLAREGIQRGPTIVWMNDSRFLREVALRVERGYRPRGRPPIPDPAELEEVSGYLASMFGGERVFSTLMVAGRVATPAEGSAPIEYPIIGVVGDPTSFDDIRALLTSLEGASPRSGSLVYVVCGREPHEIVDTIQESLFVIREKFLGGSTGHLRAGVIPIFLLPFKVPEMLHAASQLLKMYEFERFSARSPAHSSPGDSLVHASPDILADALSAVGMHLRPLPGGANRGRRGDALELYCCTPDYPGALRDLLRFVLTGDPPDPRGVGEVVDLHSVSIRICPAHPGSDVLALVSWARIVEGGDVEESDLVVGLTYKSQRGRPSERRGVRARLEDALQPASLPACPRGGGCRVHCPLSFPKGMVDLAFTTAAGPAESGRLEGWPLLKYREVEEAGRAQIAICFNDHGPGTIYRVLQLLQGGEDLPESVPGLDVLFIRGYPSKDRTRSLVLLRAREWEGKGRVSGEMRDLINAILFRVRGVKSERGAELWRNLAETIRSRLGEDYTLEIAEGEGFISIGVRKKSFACDSEECVVSSRMPQIILYPSDVRVLIGFGEQAPDVVRGFKTIVNDLKWLRENHILAKLVLIPEFTVVDEWGESQELLEVLDAIITGDVPSERQMESLIRRMVMRETRRPDGRDATEREVFDKIAEELTQEERQVLGDVLNVLSFGDLLGRNQRGSARAIGYGLRDVAQLARECIANAIRTPYLEERKRIWKQLLSPIEAEREAARELVLDSLAIAVSELFKITLYRLLQAGERLPSSQPVYSEINLRDYAYLPA